MMYRYLPGTNMADTNTIERTHIKLPSISMADVEIIEKVNEVIKVKIPSMYKVILHNDDKTTFDFVISVLLTIFHRSVDDAIMLTREIHEKGQGIAGSPYTLEIAQEKTNEVISYSRANGYPLVATYEEM